MAADAAPRVRRGGRLRSRTGEPPGFAEWYEAYPRKAKPQRAARAYSRLSLGDRRLALESLERWKQCEQWHAGKIEHPATFLNERMFKDDPPGSEGTGEGGDWKAAFKARHQAEEE